MCMAIPMQVLRGENTGAWCLGRQGEAWVDTLLTGPLEAGQWVLTFLGAAREVVSALRAAQVNAALDALEQLQSGGQPDFDACFADLIEREPQLPAHLIRAAQATQRPKEDTE